MKDIDVMKEALVSSIFATCPKEIYNGFKSTIQDIGLDNWYVGIEMLRKWSEYTKELEEQVETLIEQIESQDAVS